MMGDEKWILYSNVEQEISWESEMNHNQPHQRPVFSKEGYVVYSDEIKHKNLNVDNEILSSHTAVSAETAFEMATGLLDLTKTDIVIATTGYANHTDESLNGLFYTAIGDSQSVNVYKHKFAGSRKETIKYGVNVALFETIKKLKQNSLKNIDFVV